MHPLFNSGEMRFQRSAAPLHGSHSGVRREMRGGAPRLRSGLVLCGLIAAAAALVPRAGALEFRETSVVVESPNAPELSAVSDRSKWCLWLQPSFLKFEVAYPVAGSVETLWVPSVLEPDALDNGNPRPRPLTKTEWLVLGVSKNDFRKAAMNNAESALLPSIDVRYFRGRSEVIEYAWVESKSPHLGALLFSSAFLEVFKDAFGQKIHAVIPNEERLYVLPVHASRLDQYGDKFQRLFRETTRPVSLEAFEVSEEGVRAVGSFRLGE